MTWLDGVSSVHLVGVGGAGMSGLAKLLAQAGHTVSGSDLKRVAAFSALEALGVECWTAHHPERAGSWDLVVASSAVPMDRDPEVLAARTAGVEVWGRPRLLAEMTALRPALGFAGTHGKTTSTAMAVAALQGLGRDPTFMVGGQMADLNTNAHLGERDLFVLEADEAFGTFVDLSLEGLVVTNVEADHLDHYVSLDRLEAAFASVANATVGPVVACVDDPGAARLATAVDAVTYGLSPDADWGVSDVGHRGHSVEFRVTHGAKSWQVTVPRPGHHVVRNATGVLALIGELGLDVGAAADGLASFGGVRRRFEVRARIGGVTIIDDYAHHPTEIAATLEAARLGAPDRVVAVFQPHRFSRTEELGAAFGVALATADLVIVTDVYAAGEAPIPGVTARLVVDAARDAGAEVAYVPRRLDVAPAIADAVRPGDLVLVMGAGDVTLVPDEVVAHLSEAGS